MATDSNLKENEQVNEEKVIANKDVELDSKNKKYSMIKVVVLLGIWSLFCLYLLVFSVVAGLPYSDQELIEKAPFLNTITTIIYYTIPIIWIFVPLLIFVYKDVKKSKK